MGKPYREESMDEEVTHRDGRGMGREDMTPEIRKQVAKELAVLERRTKTTWQVCS